MGASSEIPPAMRRATMALSSQHMTRYGRSCEGDSTERSSVLVPPSTGRGKERKYFSKWCFCSLRKKTDLRGAGRVRHGSGWTNVHAHGRVWMHGGFRI